MSAETKLESVPAGSPSIKDMPEGCFWSRDIIGGTEEDRALCDQGLLTPHRAEILCIEAKKAKDRLIEMEVPGVQCWMSYERIMN